MTGKSEETGQGEHWLEAVFERMKAVIEKAADILFNEEITDMAGAEKAARSAGVIARSAKAVDALHQRFQADSEEDEMGGRTYDPAEDERIRRELAVELERLDACFEIKRAEGIEWSKAQARMAKGADQTTSDPA